MSEEGTWYCTCGGPIDPLDVERHRRDKYRHRPWFVPKKDDE
jgi:hypothetical protein